VENWVAFYFDGNQAWGFINSPQDWLDKIIIPYERESSTDMLLRACRGPNNRKNAPFFGFVVECKGISLGQWAKENGMNLPLTSSKT